MRLASQHVITLYLSMRRSVRVPLLFSTLLIITSPLSSSFSPAYLRWLLDCVSLMKSRLGILLCKPVWDIFLAIFPCQCRLSTRMDFNVNTFHHECWTYFYIPSQLACWSCMDMSVRNSWRTHRWKSLVKGDRNLSQSFRFFEVFLRTLAWSAVCFVEQGKETVPLPEREKDKEGPKHVLVTVCSDWLTWQFKWQCVCLQFSTY